MADLGIATKILSRLMEASHAFDGLNDFRFGA